MQQVAEQRIIGVGVDLFRHFQVSSALFPDLFLGHLLSAPRKDGWLAEQQMAIAEHTALCGEHCDVVLHPNEGFSKGFINILAILQCDVVLWPFVRDVMDRR